MVECAFKNKYQFTFERIPYFYIVYFDVNCISDINYPVIIITTEICKFILNLALSLTWLAI